MNWQRIKKLISIFIAAFAIAAILGVAVAQNDRDIQIFKMGTDVTVSETQVMTDVVAIGGNIAILNEGQVTQDAIAVGGDVILQPKARVGGDAVAIGGQILKEPGATVGGDEVVIFSNAGMLFNRFGLFGTLYLINAIFSLACSIIILAFGVFLLLLLPGHLQSITATMQQHPFKSGLWGFGSIVAITLSTALFAGSVFGLLLIPIINLAVAIAGLLGAIATALWVGKGIFARRNKPFVPFLIGILILAVISLIPIAGGLIVLMLNLFGLGAVLLSRVGTVPPETIKKRFDQLEGSAQSSRT